MRKSVYVLVFTLLGCFLLSLAWWNLWMYKGFIGPIPLLHWFIETDGEGSYTLTEAEMFIQLMVIAFGVFVLNKISNKRVG